MRYKGRDVDTLYMREKNEDQFPY